MADIGDHLEKLLSAWKALLPVIAVVAGGTFWFAKTLYEREISTLKTERDGVCTENPIRVYRAIESANLA
jgi:hypothetical protein